MPDHTIQAEIIGTGLLLSILRQPCRGREYKSNTISSKTTTANVAVELTNIKVAKALASKWAQRTTYEGSCPVTLVVGGNLVQMRFWKLLVPP
jgi:hypothetical protein